MDSTAKNHGITWHDGTFIFVLGADTLLGSGRDTPKVLVVPYGDRRFAWWTLPAGVSLSPLWIDTCLGSFSSATGHYDGTDLSAHPRLAATIYKWLIEHYWSPVTETEAGPVVENSRQCTCDIGTLMGQGCICGGK